MKTTSSTSHNYLLAQNKSLEYQLKITQLKLSKIQSINLALQEQLELKELEIVALNQRITKQQHNQKQIKTLKSKVDLLENEFRLELEQKIKSSFYNNNIKNNQIINSSTLRDSLSQCSRESRGTFDIKKFQRNSIGNELEILQDIFNRRFQNSDDLKSILFRFMKNISQGCNLVLLVDNSTILFDQLHRYISNLNKFSTVNELFLQFLTESKQIFSEEELSQIDE